MWWILALFPFPSLHAVVTRTWAVRPSRTAGAALRHVLDAARRAARQPPGGRPTVTHRLRSASACLVACVLSQAVGCSSQPAETPQVNGMSPGDYRDEQDAKAAQALKASKGSKAGRRR